MRLMRTAFKYYRQVHREYLWIHVIYLCVLLVTSVFWFILPFYIFYYGQYPPNIPLQLLFMGLLLLIPAAVVTLPSWFISFQAACKWAIKHPGACKWRWLLRFQAMAFSVVVMFTAIILCMMFIIDVLR
ncbi:MAG: hypothetical protein ABS949_03730 [Solibacillus sp.]